MKIYQVPFPTNINRLFVFYYLFKVLGMLASLLPIWLGYHLFILGVTGQASLSIHSKDVTGQLLNAAPGLFFGVGGIIALIIAIFKGVAVELGPDGDLRMCKP
jgi:hypothetical protein